MCVVYIYIYVYRDIDWREREGGRGTYIKDLLSSYLEPQGKVQLFRATSGAPGPISEPEVAVP